MAHKTPVCVGSLPLQIDRYILPVIVSMLIEPSWKVSAISLLCSVAPFVTLTYIFVRVEVIRVGQP
jgi:hypothetical protein